MKYFKLFIILVIIPFFSCQNKKTDVTICATIHHLHKLNQHYSYDSLFSFIQLDNPDVIGVEIRENDMDSSINYLKHSYPFEMYTCISKYGSQKKMYGFDWLGKGIEGKPIPSDYWKTFWVKKEERQLFSDSTMTETLHAFDMLDSLKTQIALNSNIYQVNDGVYDSLNILYYNRIEKLLKNTRYNTISQFYRMRDKKIAENMIKIIHENKGKRILFLTGADHRSNAIEQVKKHFGNTILLNTRFNHEN